MAPRPLTLTEAERRGLVVKNGVQTFAKGTDWEGWASGNCYECWHWDPDVAGAKCAFEGAALLHMVSLELRQMFGWTKHPEFGYDEPPDECPFFRSRHDNNGRENPPPPDPDPRQLILIADPTEVIAYVQPALEPVEVPA